MTTYEGWEHEEPDTVAACEKITLRHEIVHAFYYESGLADSSFVYDGAWAKNEEMMKILHLSLYSLTCHASNDSFFTGCPLHVSSHNRTSCIHRLSTFLQW